MADAHAPVGVLPVVVHVLVSIGPISIVAPLTGRGSSCSG